MGITWGFIRDTRERRHAALALACAALFGPLMAIWAYCSRRADYPGAPWHAPLDGPAVD